MTQCNPYIWLVYYIVLQIVLYCIIHCIILHIDGYDDQLLNSILLKYICILQKVQSLNLFQIKIQQHPLPTKIQIHPAVSILILHLSDIFVNILQSNKLIFVFCYKTKNNISQPTSMWNLLCANNILDKRAKYKAHIRHLQALRSIKSNINNKQPHKPLFLQSKQKTRLLELQKKEEIQNNNNLLVDRMQRVQPTIGNYNDVYYKVRSISQSRPYRKKQQKEIDFGNELMIKKLKGAESDYITHDILKQTNNYLIYRNNIMNSSKPASSIFDASIYSSRDGRPFSASKRPSSAPKRID